MASSIPLAASGVVSSGGAGGVPPGTGTEQQYSLRWNDYHVSILSSFRHLRDEEDFVDVTLACDGCSFTAHKVVLSACSPYFRRLLKANPCQHPIVILRDVKQRDMESLLRFMYNGEVHIGQEQLADFLKTAQTLQVRGLADVPTKDPHRLSAGSEHLGWGQHLGEGGRDDTLVTPPPAKRSRADRYSDSPAINSQGDHHRDSLLGQALEGGHQTPFNAHLQSTGEDSSTNDSASDKLEGNNNGHHGSSSRHGNSEHHLHHHHHHRERDHRDRDMVPKSEPSDYGEDLGEGMDTGSRNPYPAALLGLQGLAGLLPGPSGIHNSNQDSNFGPMMLGGELSGRDPSSLPSSSAASAVDSSGATAAAMVSPLCPFCGREYSSRGNLRQHINNVHYHPQQWASCDVCGKNFKTKHYLQNHKLYAHGLRQRTNTPTHPPNQGEEQGGVGGGPRPRFTPPKQDFDPTSLHQRGIYFPLQLRPPFIPQLPDPSTLRRDPVATTSAISDQQHKSPFTPQLLSESSPQTGLQLRPPFHSQISETAPRRDLLGTSVPLQQQQLTTMSVPRPVQASSVPPHLPLSVVSSQLSTPKQESSTDRSTMQQHFQHSPFS